MFNAIFVNWHTTIIGVLAGALQLHQGGMTWGNAFQAALLAALGLVAKDRQVTGGTKVQSSSGAF